MNASSRCCPAVRMPPRDQDVHHRRSYRDRRGTFRTLAHPAAAGWSLLRSQGRHWRMTEQDNADALDGFPCRQYGAPRADVTQPKAGGQVTTQGTGLPTKSALRATSPGDRYSRRTPAMLVPLWPHRLRLHPIMLSRRTVGHPRPAAPADERPLPSADAPLRLPRRRPGLLLALPRLPITGHRDVPQVPSSGEGQAQMTASPETVAYLKQVRDYYAAADRDGTDSYNPP